MANPQFSNNMDYFQEVLNTLYAHKWLFTYANIDILKENILERMPEDWKNFFIRLYPESNDIFEKLASGDIQHGPPSLLSFIQKIKSLTPTFRIVQTVTQNTRPEKCIGQKKHHEISLLSPLIIDLCTQRDIRYIADIGCGLGYLTCVLKQSNMNVLGIDGNANFIQTAKAKHPEIPFAHCFITSDSSAQINLLLSQSFPEFKLNADKICLVALHACGDLSVDILKLSLACPFFVLSITMPCCYHRLKKVANSRDSTNSLTLQSQNYLAFQNFPLSLSLSNALTILNLDRHFLNQPFLRLACQRTNFANLSSLELSVMARNLLYRNALEKIASGENLLLRRKRRKTGCTRAGFNLEGFLTTLEDSYELLSLHNNEGQLVPAAHKKYFVLREKITDFISLHGPQLEAIFCGWIVLQNLIQNVCEHLVLTDRCALINELINDLASCEIVKVTNECISPRCYALIVTKDYSQKQSFHLAD